MRPTLAPLLALVVCGALLAEAYLNIKAAVHAATISAVAVGLFLLCLREMPRRVMAVRSLTIVIAMPIIAWTLPDVRLLYAVMFIWVPLVGGRLNQVVPVYLFSLLLLPGLDTTVSLGSLKLFELGVHDSLAVGASFAVFLNRGKARPRLKWDVAALAVILLIGAAIARETSFSNFLRSSVNVLLDLGLPYYIVSRGMRSIEDLRAAILWLGCGAVTLSAILVYEAWKSWPIYNELYGSYGLSTLLLVKSRGGFLRSGGPFVESTSAAMVLTICILALWLSRDYFRSSRHHLLLFAVALVGLSAPQSRGAWVGLCLALGFADVCRARYVQLARKTILIGVTGAILLSAAQFSPYLSETMGLSGGSSETSDYRRHLFDRGLQEFRHRPILGYSTPEIHDRLKDLRQGEGIIDFVNTYIWIMLISGGVGLAIFAGAFIFFLLNVWRFRRAGSGPPGTTEAATFICSCLAMLMEMLFFTSFGGRPAFFVFAMFGFGAAFLNAHRSAAASAVPTGFSDAPADKLGFAMAGPAPLRSE